MFYVNFLHFLDNDDRMSSKRRNLSALVFLINSYLCNKKKITRWLEHMKFILSWKKRFHSFTVLTREIFFPLEDNLYMFALPYNILNLRSL